MEDLAELYKEHEKRVTDNIPEIKHVDLWSEQISFMSEEHPFKAPAVFFSYRIVSTTDHGEKAQLVRMQTEIYIYYETFADTSRGSKKQEKALNFLNLMTKVNACFHGCNGKTFAEMRRTGFNPVETGTANLLYVQRYEMNVIDNSAQKIYDNMKFDHVEIYQDKYEAPENTNADLYQEID